MTVPPVDARFWRAVADVLRGHDYTEGHVLETLGSSTAPMGISRLGAPMQRTAPGRPLDTLIRLFVIGTDVDEEVVASVAAPTTVDEWCANGILERVDGALRAALAIRPFGELLLAADAAGRPEGMGLRDDYVMGMSASTLGLASLTVRLPIQSTLDLGSGGGYHALLAAEHSARVVAVDINPRAVWMAQVNAVMNGIDTIEVREGDLFAPVAGETFDLIVSNPPFIIGPDISQQFLSTPRQGDAVGREIAARAPGHLNEGGYCQFLTNWISVPDEPWWDHIAPWFADSGCDVWVIRLASDRPDDYAAQWLSAIVKDPDVFEARFAAWMDTFSAAGADGVGLGFITMRKRSHAKTWMRFNDITDALTTGTGADVAHLMELETWTQEASPAELLATAFVLAPQTRVIQELRWANGALMTDSLSVRRTEGFRFPGSIDEGALDLVSRFDGRRSLADVLTEVLGPDAGEGVLAELAAMVANLVGRGLVVPVRR